MFFYLICNASIGNYQESRKKYLTTFIYGTIVYILLHAFLHTSNSQIAIYLKGYFWLIVALDCVAMYYLYAYIDGGGDDSVDGNEGEKKNLESLVNSLYNQMTGNKKTSDEQSHVPVKSKANPTENNKNNDKESEPRAYTEDDVSLQSTALTDLPVYEDDKEEEMYDNGSESGSDVDLDKFEMTLQ